VTEKTADRITRYWPIIAFLVTLIFGFGSAYMQLSSIAAEQRAMAADLRKVSEGVAVMQTAGQFNGAAIAELRGRVLTLEARR
jgi:hypothetical protein